MTPIYEVVWNGCKDAPMGPYVCVEYRHAVRVAPTAPVAPLRPYCGHLGDAMITFRRSAQTLTGWFTRYHAVEITGLDMHQVSRCIESCRRRGELAAELPGLGGRAKRGQLQRYRWVR